MNTRNIPQTGARYWAALSAASVFGANMGDFFSHNLHLGHTKGLAPLAVLFGLILGGEHLFGRRNAIRGTTAFYWLAIVTLRTAATNLGDLTTHDFDWPPAWVMAGLLLALVVLVVAGSRRAASPGSTVPRTDGFYWTAMLIAGTLGTVAGDYVSGDLGLGVGLGSVVLCGVLAVTLALRKLPGFATAATYWLCVVAIRTAGTTVGDYTAFRHGLGLGLPASTAASGLIMVAVLVFWPRKENEESSIASV
jgi:uncharacterized membrane-anchored protein